MSVNFRSIRTALENGKEITALHSQKNDQSSTQYINYYRVILLFLSGNSIELNSRLQSNVANDVIHNYSDMNNGGAA